MGRATKVYKKDSHDGDASFNENKSMMAISASISELRLEARSDIPGGIDPSRTTGAVSVKSAQAKCCRL